MSSSSIRWIRLLVGLAVLSIILVAALPTLLCRSGMLQQIVNSQLQPLDLRMELTSATFGWFTPTEFTEVRIHDVTKQWDLSAKEIKGELTLWQLVSQGNELGTIVIDSPTVIVPLKGELQLPPLPDEPDSQARRGDDEATASVNVQIRNGTILVRVPDQPEPVEFVTKINVVARWSKSAAGKVLLIEPGRAIERVALTPEMCDLGLKYVAPILADVGWTQGDLSLEIDECRLVVGEPTETVARGRVALNSVEAGLRSPLAKRIVEVVSLATETDLPESVRLAKNSVIQFDVENAQVRHEGLEFGLPDVSPDLVIRTQGTVGFDKQLDLRADVPLPLGMLGDGPIARRIGNQTLSLPVKGSLDQPEVRVEGDGQLVSTLVSELLTPLLKGEPTTAATDGTANEQSESADRKDPTKETDDPTQEKENGDSLEDLVGDINLDDIADLLDEIRARRQERREERGPLFPRLRERRRARNANP